MRLLAYVILIFSAMLMAGIYGAVHDQISCLVSAEYFTKFKFIQFKLAESHMMPAMKVAVIGFLASWWMGLPIGLIVGAFGFLHHPFRDMIEKTMRAYGVVVLVAFAVGLCGLLYGYAFASHDPDHYPHWFFPADLDRPRNYIAVGYMHNLSYLGGVLAIPAGIAAQFVLRGKRV